MLPLIKSHAKQCESMMKQHSSSFYQAFRGLPSPKKEAVFVIYAFCRIIDDAIDEPEISYYTIDELTSLFNDLKSAEGHFIWPSLRWLFDQFPMLTKEPFYTQIKGQRIDEHLTDYHTFDQLERYCYHVAGSVGEMLLPVLHDNPNEQITASGVQLGKAMQIVNILRDVGEDQQRGRKYLPTSFFEAYGYEQKAYQNQKIDASFIAMIDELMLIAEDWFEQGIKGIETYSDESSMAIRLASKYYAAILQSIKDNHYDVFTKRAYVSQRKKLMLLAEVKIEAGRRAAIK